MFASKRFKVWKQLSVLILLVLVSLFFSGCGKKEKVYHVGILSGLDYIMEITDGFKAKMTELGYIEGKNIIYDLQKSNSDLEEFKEITKKFVNDKVDLIFCFPTEAALESKEATKGTNIPVVFTFTNIEGTDLVKSIREPGGNVTGVRYPGPDLTLKRFDIMRQLSPDAKRYLIPYHPDLPVCYPQLDVLRPAAQAAGITLVEATARDVKDLEALLQPLDKPGDPGVDAILSIAESLSVTPDTFLVMSKFAAKHKIPMGGALMEFEGYSSVFGVNTQTTMSGKSAAVIADKILKGTPAGSLPVVSDENFFEINYKLAKELELNVTDDLLSQAHNVIK